MGELIGKSNGNIKVNQCCMNAVLDLSPAYKKNIHTDRTLIFTGKH
jgi:hypothetical protein